jgi:CRP-like cAMP-binding protein
MYIDNKEIAEIFKDITFTNEELETIKSLLTKKVLKKGTILIKNGNIVLHTYGILEGCLRSYYIDKLGKEHTLQFAIKGWWISDFTAFFSSSKAILNLEVLRDAIVYELSLNNRELLFIKFPKIETYIRKKLENAYSTFQKRILSYLSQTATERYLNFIKTYPNIEKNVKNYHIASYLGITTESLSRIRRELI